MAFLNAFSALGRILLLATIACVGFALATGGDARMALLIVALSLGITGLTFVIIGSRLGRVSSIDRGLRETGVGGSATVTALRETHVIVNGSPVYEFTLDVDATSHAPYSTTIRQRTPRFMTAAVLPGAVVGVIVDPIDREHLAIDWEARREAPQPDIEDSATPIARPSVRDVDRLLKVGRAARAVVISMHDAGDMSELGLVEVGRDGDDDRLFVIDMEVQQAGMDPYEVRVAHRVPERLVGKIGPRTKLAVAVDRSDDHAVAIDWEALHR